MLHTPFSKASTRHEWIVSLVIATADRLAQSAAMTITQRHIQPCKTKILRSLELEGRAHATVLLQCSNSSPSIRLLQVARQGKGLQLAHSFGTCQRRKIMWSSPSLLCALQSHATILPSRRSSLGATLDRPAFARQDKGGSRGARVPLTARPQGRSWAG